MSKIRPLYYFDKKKMLEMISFLNNHSGDSYLSGIMFNPLILIHYLLPLKFKYLPESYVLKDKHDIKGLITVLLNRSVQKKAEIKKLFFEENSYEEAAELVQFAVSKYKAMGAASVLVKIDDYLPELISMFVCKCGFSQLSYERLWRVTKFPDTDYDKRNFRYYRNSDAQAIASIYNDSLPPNFRPLLSKDSKEFKDSIFKGLLYFSEYKYTIINKKTRNIIGCVLIKTYDNHNYTVDIIQNEWDNIDINAIINFAADKIRKRNKKFGFFVKSKRYTYNGEKIEQLFFENGFDCIQNQMVLTNSSARVLRVEEKTGKYTAISDYYTSSVMPT